MALTPAALKQALTDRIHLGLDLKGGTHLVLQVHVAEAVGSTTDRDVQRLEDDLEKAGVTGATVGKLDPVAHPEAITVSGVAAGQCQPTRAAFCRAWIQQLRRDHQPRWRLEADDEAGRIRDLETRTLDTSIETIRERIDKLGVTEPVIQKYGLGDNEILVELPGIDDPARVEDIIQSTAKLEIHAVVGQSYESDAGRDRRRWAACFRPTRSWCAGEGIRGRVRSDLGAAARQRGGRYGLPRCAALDGRERPAQHHASH